VWCRLLLELEPLLPGTRRCRRAVVAGRRPAAADARARDRFLALLRELLGGYASQNLREFDTAARGEFVEDLCSAVLIALPEADFGPGGRSLGPWLAAAARHAAANLRRSRRRRRSAPLGESLPSRRDGPVDSLLRQEDVKLVRRAMAPLRRQVSPTAYQVLVLLDLQGRDVEEVCRQLGLTARKVWNYHHRARQALRKIITALDASRASPRPSRKNLRNP